MIFYFYFVKRNLSFASSALDPHTQHNLVGERLGGLRQEVGDVAFGPILVVQRDQLFAFPFKDDRPRHGFVFDRNALLLADLALKLVAKIVCING